MNKQAERHLIKAEGYLMRGDEFHRKAAAEIVLAQKADPTLSGREIGERFGRSRKWVEALVAWHTTGQPDAPIDWKRGSHATTAEIEAGARRLIERSPKMVVGAIKENPRLAEAIARDDKANSLVIEAQVHEGIRRREEGDTRERFVVDPDLVEKSGPWGLIVRAVRAVHQAFQRWDDDVSWGKLWMDEGESAVRHELDEIESTIQILTRMRDTGRAFVENTIDQEVQQR